MGEERRSVAMGHGDDEAVHHPPGRDARPPASTVDAGSGVEIGCGVEREEIEAYEEPAQGSCALIVTGAGHDLHQYGLGDGERPLITDQLGQSLVNRTAGRPVVFDPGRRVGEDHSASGVSSGGTSPMAPTPRIAKTSSRVIG